MRDTSGRFPALPIPEEVDLRGRIERPSLALAGSAILLALIGLSTVRSASTELSIDYFPRQSLWVVAGILVMAFGMALSYKLMLRFALPVYFLGLILLVGILTFGHEAGGARSWIGIAGFGLQPSELMKLATLLVLVRFLSSNDAPQLDLPDLARATAIVAVPFSLIYLEPDLGSALILFAILGALVLVAGLTVRTVVALGLVAVLLGAGVWAFALQDYQKARVMTFVQPGSDPLGAGYQIRQSKIAVGSGEILGKGYMQGTQSQLRFLPARHTDFIFAVLAEEHGFLGVVVVLGLYLVFLYNGTLVAIRAGDRQGMLLVVGLLAVLTFHILFNTSMMVGLVPITGLPLPFLSYGGSFTLFCFFATGVILSVDLRRYVNR